MKVSILIQARSGGSRFPGKVFEPIGDHSILKWVYNHAQEAAKLVKDVEVTTHIIGTKNDAKLEHYCNFNHLNARFPDVPEDDLIARYLAAAKDLGSTHIVRLTADCWSHSAPLIAEAIGLLKNADYVCNTCVRTFIEGLDVQACSIEALEWVNATQTKWREHPFFDLDHNLNTRLQFEENFKITFLLNPKYQFLLKGMSIDTQEDLERARDFYAKETSRLVLGGAQ